MKLVSLYGLGSFEVIEAIVRLRSSKAIAAQALGLRLEAFPMTAE